MTYQFDPRPEGLHYEPFTVSFCAKTMWFLRDGAPEPWIDLRSVFEALGMSWARKWGMYCLAKRGQWSLAACCDRSKRETLLAPGGKIPAILGEVHDLLGGHHAAARRARWLHEAWRGKYADIRAGGAKTRKIRAVTPNEKSTGAQRGRKVNAYVVRQMFVLLQKRHTKPAIAKVLRVSLATVQQVARGTYKLEAEAQDVWWATFGAPQKGAETVVTPSKNRAEVPGHATHGLGLCDAPQAVLSGLAKTGAQA